MKFTAGYWEIRPEVKMIYAEEVFDVQTDAEGMTVYASSRHLNNRGDTLNLPTFTVRYTSPMPNIIRVQIVRHKGALQLGPEFKLNTQPATVQAVNRDESVTLTAGDLSVQVAKNGGWQVRFMAGEKKVTGSSWHAVALARTDEDRYVMEQLDHRCRQISTA